MGKSAKERIHEEQEWIKLAEEAQRSRNEAILSEIVELTGSEDIDFEPDWSSVDD